VNGKQWQLLANSGNRWQPNGKKSIPFFKIYLIIYFKII